MTTTHKISPDDPRLTAFALGELEGEELAAVEAALRDDPAARAAEARRTELERAFDALRTAPDEAGATLVEGRIRMLWAQSATPSTRGLPGWECAQTVTGEHLASGAHARYLLESAS